MPSLVLSSAVFTKIFDFNNPTTIDYQTRTDLDNDLANANEEQIKGLFALISPPENPNWLNLIALMSHINNMYRMYGIVWPAQELFAKTVAEYPDSLADVINNYKEDQSFYNMDIGKAQFIDMILESLRSADILHTAVPLIYKHLNSKDIQTRLNFIDKATFLELGFFMESSAKVFSHINLLSDKEFSMLLDKKENRFIDTLLATTFYSSANFAMERAVHLYNSLNTPAKKEAFFLAVQKARPDMGNVLEVIRLTEEFQRNIKAQETHLSQKAKTITDSDKAENVTDKRNILDDAAQMTDLMLKNNRATLGDYADFHKEIGKLSTQLETEVKPVGSLSKLFAGTALAKSSPTAKVFRDYLVKAEKVVEKGMGKVKAEENVAESKAQQSSKYSR